MLDKLAESLPEDDPQAQNYVSALRKELASDEAEKEEAAKNLKAYEEAYEKLTAPANKIGVFLRALDDGKVLIALGDTEYVALVDPKMEGDLTAGARVMLNDAYAVVGVVPTAPIGDVHKINEVMGDGRLRVGADVQGGHGRVVQVADELKETKLRIGDEIRLDQTGRMAIEHFERKETQE